MTARTETNRFQDDARKYADYLETPEGRLRADLAFANLEEFLGSGEKSRHVLDLGCGTGATAIRLAHLGFQVTMLDSSPAMLDLAQRDVEQSGVAERISLRLGNAAHPSDLFTTDRFDVILCHNLLEYVDDPDAVLVSAASLMRDASAILSVLVRNQAGEVLKAALQAGDLAAAEHNLTADWGQESLYKGKVRLFGSDDLETMLKRASLTLIARRGVRVIADYLPPRISRSEDYEQIFSLERKIGRRPEFAAVARYMQYLARSAAL